MSAVGYLIDWEQVDGGRWSSRYGTIEPRGHLWDILPAPDLILRGTCAWIVGVHSLQEAFHWYEERVGQLDLL